MSPKVSVVMSMYNSSSTLKKCIDSIIDQSYKDWEMIICDDGSQDNSHQIALEYSEKYQNIKLLRNTRNMGLAYSLNKCIDSSEAQYIARQDSDDWSDSERLQKQVDFMDENLDYAFVGTCCFAVGDNGELSKCRLKEDLGAIDLIKGRGFIHGSVMMRRDALEEVGLYTVRKETIRSQDYDLLLKLYSKGYKAHNIQEYLYYYRATESTFLRSNNWRRVYGLMWIRYNGYRRNRFPLWSYAYVLKPFVAALVPKRIMRRHFNRVFKKEKFT